MVSFFLCPAIVTGRGRQNEREKEISLTIADPPEYKDTWQRWGWSVQHSDVILLATPFPLCPLFAHYKFRSWKRSARGRIRHHLLAWSSRGSQETTCRHCLNYFFYNASLQMSPTVLWVHVKSNGWGVESIFLYFSCLTIQVWRVWFFFTRRCSFERKNIKIVLRVWNKLPHAR